MHPDGARTLASGQAGKTGPPEVLHRVASFVRGMWRVLSGAAERQSIGAAVEANAVRFGDRPAVLFEDRELTWDGFNRLSNRFAHYLSDQGVAKGDTVAVLMDNRVELLAIAVALAKIGAVGGIVNTQLRGKALVHCVRSVAGSRVIVGEELTDTLAAVRGELALRDGRDFIWVADRGRGAAPPWACDFATEAAGRTENNPPETGIARGKDPCYYIFTSGTTGLPKAAIMSHGRWFKAAWAFGWTGLAMRPDDRMYICLPLYHNNALTVAFGSVVTSGASLVLQRKFSASSFWDDVRRYRANCFVYIGEMCRYLYNQPERPDDAANPVTKIIGNGLRPDIWPDFKRRFGIERVVEFYAASEGNSAFINVFNRDCTIGTTVSPFAVVQYDIDTDTIVRDARGRCRKVRKGEPGLLLTRITPRYAFDGYTDPEATEKKIVRDAFRRGDAWFNTGDMIRRVRVGGLADLRPHFQFVDRVGDTFRWKGENVSTHEVSELINEHPQVRFSNVYGVQVPGAEGRAGMAALALDCREMDFDPADFARHVNERLPAYARPVFLRLIGEFEMTETFKLKKGRLREQGFRPDGGTVLVYDRSAGTYTPLDETHYERIMAGRADL